MRDALIEELAGVWEVMAEMETDTHAKRRETLRECADALRMLLSMPPATTPVETPPKSERARVPMTPEQIKTFITQSDLWDMHLHMGWYSVPARSFAEKAVLFIRNIERHHGIGTEPARASDGGGV